MMTVRPRSNLGVLLVIHALGGFNAAATMADKDAEADGTDTTITFCLRGQDGPLVCFRGRPIRLPGSSDDGDFETRQQRLHEELTRRADEARRKLEASR